MPSIDPVKTGKLEAGIVVNPARIANPAEFPEASGVPEAVALETKNSDVHLKSYFTFLPVPTTI